METLGDPELVIITCIGLLYIVASILFQSVRHVALVALNSAAHNKPALIRDLLDIILPKLYIETKIRVSPQLCSYM